MAWNEGQLEPLAEMLEVGPGEGEAQALPGQGRAAPRASVTSFAFCFLMSLWG